MSGWALERSRQTRIRRHARVDEENNNVERKRAPKEDRFHDAGNAAGNERHKGAQRTAVETVRPQHRVSTAKRKVPLNDGD